MLTDALLFLFDENQIVTIGHLKKLLRQFSLNCHLDEFSTACKDHLCLILKSISFSCFDLEYLHFLRKIKKILNIVLFSSCLPLWIKIFFFHFEFFYSLNSLYYRILDDSATWCHRFNQSFCYLINFNKNMIVNYSVFCVNVIWKGHTTKMHKKIEEQQLKKKNCIKFDLIWKS